MVNLLNLNEWDDVWQLTDREMDEVVAVEIFKWSWVDNKLCPNGIKLPNVYYQSSTNDGVPVTLPAYSSDIKIAWTIIDELLKTRGLLKRFEQNWKDIKGDFFFDSSLKMPRLICFCAIVTVSYI